MITSTSNPRIKELIQWQTKPKARSEAGLFLVEGRRLVSEAPAEDVLASYATESFAVSPEGQELCRRLGSELVSENVFERVSDTRSPQGILAVVRRRTYRLEDLPDGPLLALERVQDPGNVGTLFRTAEAAGMAGILLDEQTADPTQPKAARATMGAVFRLPYVVCSDLTTTVETLRQRGYRSYAAHLSGTRYYDEVRYPARSIFLLGNEGAGLSEALTAAADEKILIPMEGQTESLNVSVAGAILAYEHYRQKRTFS